MIIQALFFIAFAGLTVFFVTLVVGVVRALLHGKAVSPYGPLFRFLTATFYISFVTLMVATLLQSLYLVR